MSQFGYNTKEQAALDAIQLSLSELDVLQAAKVVSTVLAYLLERACENPDGSL